MRATELLPEQAAVNETTTARSCLRRIGSSPTGCSRVGPRKRELSTRGLRTGRKLGRAGERLRFAERDRLVLQHVTVDVRHAKRIRPRAEPRLVEEVVVVGALE